MGESRIIFIVGPMQRIFEDIRGDFIVRTLVADDMFVIVTLPEAGGQVDAFGGLIFEISNDLSQRMSL